MRRQEETISRRTLVGAMAAGAAVTGSRSVMAQAQKGTPQTVISTPSRDFGPHGAPSTYFWDPDVVIVDPALNLACHGARAQDQNFNIALERAAEPAVPGTLLRGSPLRY